MMMLLQCSLDAPTLDKGSAAAQAGHTEFSTQHSFEDLSSFLAASRELCHAMATYKLGITVHAQPQESTRELDGAAPGNERGSSVKANVGSLLPVQKVLRAEKSWALSQTPHKLRGFQCMTSTQLPSEQVP